MEYANKMSSPMYMTNQVFMPVAFCFIYSCLWKTKIFNMASKTMKQMNRKQLFCLGGLNSERRTKWLLEMKKERRK